MRRPVSNLRLGVTIPAALSGRLAQPNFETIGPVLFPCGAHTDTKQPLGCEAECRYRLIVVDISVFFHRIRAVAKRIAASCQRSGSILVRAHQC